MSTDENGAFEIGNRLRRLRDEAGLSTRAFAGRLASEAGHDVSHSTVWKYERAETVPSDYLAAVAAAFDVDPAWLLTGRRRSGNGATDPEAVRAEWERFRRGLSPRHPLREVIVASWERSREAGVPADADGDPSFRRVGPEELARRRRTCADLLAAARPHLDWLAAATGIDSIVVYLTDADGIVLDAQGGSGEELEHLGLAPGFDWSEERMGTNGAGTALEADRPVVVLGPEHYARWWHDFLCTGAPIHGPDGEVVGAVDVSTTLAAGSPSRLGLVAYVALAIESSLWGNGSVSAPDVSAPDGHAAPRNTAAPGSGPSADGSDAA